MKNFVILFVLGCIFFSCKKEEKKPILPQSMAINQAFDSMNMDYRGFYRSAIDTNRTSRPDSAWGIIFHSFDSIAEYKITIDTLGLHRVDSAFYRMPKYNAEYQKSDPNFFQYSVGYVRINYYPRGGSANGFFIHDQLIKDTFHMTAAVGSRFYIGVGSFNGKVTGGQPATITFFR